MLYARSLLTSPFFCEHCQKETRFLPIHFALAVAGVSRSTIYYWMEHGWIHWRRLPSGRRVICQESLSQCDLDSTSISASPEKYRPKLSNPVQSGKLTRH